MANVTIAIPTNRNSTIVGVFGENDDHDEMGSGYLGNNLGCHDCDQVLVFRTQTAEEGLKESLLSVITASDNVTLDVLNEAFCRDAEAFSEAFQVY